MFHCHLISFQLLLCNAFVGFFKISSLDIKIAYTSFILRTSCQASKATMNPEGVGTRILVIYDQGPAGPPPVEGAVVRGVRPMTPKIVTKRPFRPQLLKPLFVRGESLLVSRSLFAGFIEAKLPKIDH